MRFEIKKRRYIKKAIAFYNVKAISYLTSHAKYADSDVSNLKSHISHLTR